MTQKGSPLVSVIVRTCVLVESCSKGVVALKPTRSLDEVEEIFKNTLGGFPESRLRPIIKFFD